MELKQGGYGIFRWDVATNQARVLIEDNMGGEFSYATISPDERMLARTRLRSLEVRPMSGSAWMRLATTSSNETFFDATPDGNWIYYRDRDTAGKPALFRVATSGGPGERMGDFPEGEAGTMRISPDGNKVVVSLYNASNGYETWSLENFVPSEPRR
jgi:Tol biopolymer transport system component